MDCASRMPGNRTHAPAYMNCHGTRTIRALHVLSVLHAIKFICLRINKYNVLLLCNLFALQHDARLWERHKVGLHEAWGKACSRPCEFLAPHFTSAFFPDILHFAALIVLLFVGLCLRKMFQTEHTKAVDTRASKLERKRPPSSN